MSLKLYNTLSHVEEYFTPIDSNNIRMYVCGPTVYDRPHIGNARSIVVYDVLYRLLLEKYGVHKVTYVRNITDVDDKINAAAKKHHVSIKDLTNKIIGYFNEDIKSLNCLAPNIEPKATEHIDEMVSMIKVLEKNGNAYFADGHVYFSVSSYANYGDLSGRSVDEMLTAVRVDMSAGKRHDEDFVLWKPRDNEDDVSSVFQSPWGEGRPGWHIECSAMSTKYLGENFDIHGGGIDLIFPHHTNEIAQSCACYSGSLYAKHWVHNGFLTVDGEKMSKSVGNFFTVKDLLDQGVKGEVIRYVYLSSHYRKPLNWTQKSVDDAKKSLDNFYRILEKHADDIDLHNKTKSYDSRVLASICNDINTPEALSYIHDIAKEYNKFSGSMVNTDTYASRGTGTETESTKLDIAVKLYHSGKLLGLFYSDPKSWFKFDGSTADAKEDAGEITNMIAKRIEAKKSKNWAEADAIREKLKSKNIILEDHNNGTTSWRYE